MSRTVPSGLWVPAGAFALAASVLVLAPLSTALAENWPHWRGPDANGTSREEGLPVAWSRERHVDWRLELPGPAGSTPVAWGERIFLTFADGAAEGVGLGLLCVSTQGKELWRRKLGGDNKLYRTDEGNSASPSPVTNGAHVWALDGTGTLACFDRDGEAVWSTDLQERYGKFDLWFGMASSPLLHDGRLYVMVLQMENSYLLALEAATGKEVWKRGRETDAEEESRHSYASPILYSDDKQKLLLIHGGDYLTAHRLDDGEEVWRVGELNVRSKYDRTLRFIASPSVTPGLVVVPSAKGGPVIAVRPSADGKIEQLWKFDRTPDVSSPLIHEGLVYLLQKNGVLDCLEAETGEPVYQVSTHSHQHRASPILADGKIYCAARDGVVTVVELGREGKILATNDMEEPIASSPVPANGKLYLRTFAALYQIDEGAPAGEARAAAGAAEPE